MLGDFLRERGVSFQNFGISNSFNSISTKGVKEKKEVTLSHDLFFTYDHKI